MKTYNIAKILFCFFLFVVGMLSSYVASSQITGLRVETYYIADANDATDTTGGRSLSVGEKTFRVYVELMPGSRVKKVYGDIYHPLTISSTYPFYNNIDRPASVFGYQIKSSWISDNPTLALDSWLTIGMATTTQKGVLKSIDPDGDDIAGLNNTGGTALISSGLLANTDPLIGIPLTTSDGLVPNNFALGQWTDVGFKDLSGNDTTVFGPIATGNILTCNNCAIQQNNAIGGPTVDSTKVLIAQLTTFGELSFQINLTIEELDSLGNSSLVNYVATDDTLLSGEQVSPFLQYPQACGCRDTRYLEYGANYGCDNIDSCKTLIVFGCTDTMACNYDPSANFNISTLCCYPGKCNDRDISLVCPELNGGKFAKSTVNVFPNPTADQISIEVYSKSVGEASVKFLDVMGKVIQDFSFTLDSEITNRNIDISFLRDGVYFILVSHHDKLESKRIVKIK